MCEIGKLRGLVFVIKWSIKPSKPKPVRFLFTFFALVSKMGQIKKEGDLLY